MKTKRLAQILSVFLVLGVLSVSVDVLPAQADSPWPFSLPERNPCQSAWDDSVDLIAAAAYNMTAAEVVTGLQHGATLAELAPSQRELVALQGQLALQRNERIDQAVADGIITGEQGNVLKLLVPQSVNFLVTNGGGPYWGQGFSGGRIWGKWRESAAAYLNLSLEKLADALLAGNSLGELAEMQGADIGGLVVALLVGIQEKLDKAVESGLLAPQPADRISEGLRMGVSRLIYTTGPCSSATLNPFNR
jgi:hypothetical protein